MNTIRSNSCSISNRISDEEINDNTKIVKSIAESGLLIKCVSEKIKNKAKKQIGEFIGIILVTLGVSFLRNLLTGKGTIRADKGTVGTGENF